VQLKPGHAVLGNLVYTYRTRMDVGGGVNRDVDVVISSTDVASLNGNPHGVSSTGHINVVFIYAAALTTPATVNSNHLPPRNHLTRPFRMSAP